MRRALLALLLLAAACRGDAPGDPPRHTGRESCARCGMAVSEKRFAGGWVDESGESVLFDDAGELLAALAERPALAAAAWVGDFESGRWIRLKEATLLRAPGLSTPMGSGVVAFASAGAAEALVRQRAGAERLEPPKGGGR